MSQTPNETLITASSVTPEPDQACASVCYYVGWDFDHAHSVLVEQTDTTIGN